jgi:hypothetical protein
LLKRLIIICLNEKNKKLVFLDKEITFLLFDLINSSELNVYENGIIFMCNVCGIECVEEKNKII